MPLAPGEARLEFARVDGATALVGCAARSPLQILAPRRRGAAAWAVVASHGGGFVAGDRVRLDVTLGEGATALVATQAETKVYRSAGAEASSALAGRVGAGGALAVLADPVSCFATARWSQRQDFRLAAGASLLVVDALVAGRVARGERWEAARARSENRVWLDGRLVAWDALELAPRPGAPLAARLAGFDALALVLAVGPAFAAGAEALAAALSSAPCRGDAPVLAAASRLGSGIAVRVGARSAHELDAWLRASLAFAAGPLGGDPYSRRW